MDKNINEPLLQDGVPFLEKSGKKVEVAKVQEEESSAVSNAGKDIKPAPVAVDEKTNTTLANPKDMCPIPNFNDEKKENGWDDDNKSKPKTPIQIYLGHCQNYAQRNLVTKDLKILPYKFKKEDLENKLLPPDITFYWE